MSRQSSRSSSSSETKDTNLEQARPGNAGNPTWDNCDDCPDMQRLFLKEQAVADAENYLNQLSALIGPSLANEHAADQEIKSGLEELKDWVEEMHETENKHHAFELLIGVAGSTGAGKTSLLNALLGIQEFLPSSCEQAATAVVCQVSWNHDMRPGFEYRAEVDFHSYAEVEKEVSELFEALDSLDEIDNRDDGNEDARIQDLAEAQTVINDVLGKVQAVWGHDLSTEELQHMTPETLMESNKDVLRLLGTTMDLHHSDPDQLSREVRPYLDSTTHSHGTEGKQFAAWPLVKHVRQFLRADILKCGISLVDLPGLGDMVESRAAVAQKYYEKLAVTVIVAPVIRAADEKTAHSLLGDYQELRLQMDGRYHRKGFGFVLTKTDDINIRSLMTRSKEIQSQPQAMDVYKKIEKLSLKIKNIEHQLKVEERSLEAKRKKSKKSKKQVSNMVAKFQEAKPKHQAKLQEKIEKLKSSRSEASKTLRGQRDKVISLSEAKAQKIKAREFVESKLAYLCTRTRNRFVQNRIQKDLKNRQKKFRGSRETHEQAATRNSIEIIPVSSVAFWKLKNSEAQSPGFPREAYTGIPQTKQWLWESTVELREQHLDTILNSYAKLLNWIRQWSQDDEDEEVKVIFTKKDVDDALSTIHKNSLELLQLELASFNDQIARIDPLQNKNHILTKCADKVNRVIGRWHLKEPENLASTANMHYNTHNAILKRDGARYKSPTSSIEYDWVQSLANSMLRLLVQDWDQAMNQDMPALLTPIMERVEIVWHNYIQDILYSLSGLSPDLAEPLERSLPSFEPVKNVISNEVRISLGRISEDAATSHPQLMVSIHCSMHPMCQGALDIAGKGCFERRKEFIREQGFHNGSSMFQKALLAMDKRLKASKERIPKEFDDISRKAIAAVVRHLSALYENILSGEVNDASTRNSKLRLQAEVRKLAVQWQASWNSGRELQIEDTVDTQIPEEFDSDPDAGADDESHKYNQASDDDAMAIDSSDGEDSE